MIVNDLHEQKKTIRRDSGSCRLLYSTPLLVRGASPRSERICCLPFNLEVRKQEPKSPTRCNSIRAGKTRVYAPVCSERLWTVGGGGSRSALCLQQHLRPRLAVFISHHACLLLDCTLYIAIMHFTKPAWVQHKGVYSSPSIAAQPHSFVRPVQQRPGQTTLNILMPRTS